MKQHMEFLRENTLDLISIAAPRQKRHMSSSDEFAGSSGLCCLSGGFHWKSSVGNGLNGLVVVFAVDVLGAGIQPQLYLGFLRWGSTGGAELAVKHGVQGLQQPVPPARL